MQVVTKSKEKIAGPPSQLIIARSAFCSELRGRESAELAFGEVILKGARPHLPLQKRNTTGDCRWRVPLWWDAGTLADLVSKG